MKLFVITPIYATTTGNQGATPVVHYFAKEWVKMGQEVIVFQFVAKYPGIMYWAGRHFQHLLNTRLGMLVPVEKPYRADYEVDGVVVHRRCLRKFRPHARYRKKRLAQAIGFIRQEIDKQGIPDWFIGHWDNPQLELLETLKRSFGRPTCLVLHSNDFDFEIKYGKEGLKMLANIDVIGFRSISGQNRYEEKYGRPLNSFIASSGVSEDFILAGAMTQKVMRQPIRSFIFVGSLIKRKNPSQIVTALSRVYPNGDFILTFIGDGAERDTIIKRHQLFGGLGEVRFIGRIPREEIIQHLRQADVFIMISKDEIFGLVYLEAMAMGLIPIGSRNEGIDGIIRDGENGFLCEAGNADELTCVLKRIKEMSSDSLDTISRNAKQTAQEYSDKGMAKRYINNLKVWEL